MDANIRKFENVHILLWLLKDLCRVMDCRPSGVIMIVPTVAIAVRITVLGQRSVSELIQQSRRCLLDLCKRDLDDRRILLQ